MHQTPEQRHILKTSWLAGAFFLLVYSFILHSDGSYPGSIVVRENYQFLLPYAYMLLMWCVWSWDWLVKRNFLKAGILLAVTAGCWAINTFLVNRKFVLPEEPTLKQYLVHDLLLSPFLWICVGRALLEWHPRRSAAALLAGIILFFLLDIHYQGQSGLSIFVLPYLVIIDYVFSGNMQQTLAEFMYSPLGAKMMTLFTVACHTFMVQWVFQFFCNRSDPERRSTANGIFGREFTPASGRYFAALFPVLYILTIAAASSVVIYTASLLTGGHGRAFSFFRGYRIGISLSNIRGLPWIMLPISLFFTIVCFRVLRTLTLSRCLATHRKFGFVYLLAFVPFLNIISWIILSVSRTPTDEHSRMDFAVEMNNPLVQRSTFTVNLLITLAVLNAAFTLFTGFNNGDGGFLGIIILLLTLGMYIGFVYRPDMIYGVIGVRLVFLTILLLVHDIRISDRVLGAFFTMYSILMLFWQIKIFHPDIEIPVNVTFDSEGNGEQEPVNSA